MYYNTLHRGIRYHMIATIAGFLTMVIGAYLILAAMMHHEHWKVLLIAGFGLATSGFMVASSVIKSTSIKDHLASTLSMPLVVTVITIFKFFSEQKHTDNVGWWVTGIIWSAWLLYAYLTHVATKIADRIQSMKKSERPTNR